MTFGFASFIDRICTDELMQMQWSLAAGGGNLDRNGVVTVDHLVGNKIVVRCTGFDNFAVYQNLRIWIDSHILAQTYFGRGRRCSRRQMTCRNGTATQPFYESEDPTYVPSE